MARQQRGRRRLRTRTPEDLIDAVNELGRRVDDLEKRQAQLRVNGAIALVAVDLGGSPPVYQIELRNQASGAVIILGTL